MPGRPQNTLEIPRAMVRVCPETGCHEWTGARTRAGYGQRRAGGRVWYVHRLAFHLFWGGLSGDEDIHHDCGNPACCNIRHLRSLSRAEHMQQHTDGPDFTQPVCKNGHKADWKLNSQGQRVCGQCKKEADHRAYKRKRGG